MSNRNSELAFYTAVMVFIGLVLVMHSLRDEPLCEPYRQAGIENKLCIGGH